MKLKVTTTYKNQLLILLFSLSINAFGQYASHSKPNIFIYIADDQNSWDYEIFGNNQVKTNNFDRLVHEGLRFSNAYTTQAVCAPSRSQLFTGLFPMKNGCYANHLPVRNVKDINDFMSELGYDVVLAGKGHIKPNSVFNWNRYFPTNSDRLIPIKKVEDFIVNTQKPLCIIFSSDLPHGPFPKSNGYNNKPLDYDPTTMNVSSKIGDFKAGYYQNIEDDNAQLGRVLNMLETVSDFDDSIFIYISDHGLKGKWSVRETGLKIPMVIRWPNVIPPNTTNDKLVSIVDILPTIIEISGGEKIERLDGKSLTPILSNTNISFRDYIFGIATRQNIQKCYVFPSRSVRDNRYKYVVNYNAKEVVQDNLGSNKHINYFIERGANQFANVPFEELYDLERDPYEHVNLAQDESLLAIKQKLSTVLNDWMNSQNDVLAQHKMPILKPTLHPLDRPSKWNNPKKEFQFTLSSTDYIPSHY
ncbi:MAG: sulfatase [Flavobacteriaceae bacterium]|nr:sulfatase [Flavobacteriaceae bacterium]